MFAADLSWVDPSAEKVGQRKVRKERQAKEREGSLRGSTSSSQESGTVWRTSTRSASKTASKTDSSKSRRSREQEVSRPLPPSRSGKPSALPLRDPCLQPEWTTYAAQLSPSLPSGAPLDPPPSVISASSYALGSRWSNSTTERFDRSELHTRDGSFNGTINRSYEKVIDEVYEVQRLSPKSFISRNTEVQVTVGNPPVHELDTKSIYSVEISTSRKPAELEGDNTLAVPDESQRSDAWSPSRVSPTLASWKPPAEWDVILSEQNQERASEKKRESTFSFTSDGGCPDLTHFQRFIRRMQGAGPRVILDRLKEEWNEPVDEDALEELSLEKQLWVLTALQLQALDESGKPNQTVFGHLLRLPGVNQRKRVLELYGNLAEVYQLSAMQPKDKIYYLSTKPQTSLPIPSNVSFLSVPRAGLLPFPYASSSFDHVRASSVPALVPSSSLPPLLKECHRILAPGGILEFRIMDPTPERRTMGPKLRTWMEERLLLGLERTFRCGRPGYVVPGWIKDAGFTPLLSAPTLVTQSLRLVAASGGDINDELAMHVGRALWRDIWGEFVEQKPGEPRWWWEVDEIVQECLEHKTVFECGTLYAFKE